MITTTLADAITGVLTDTAKGLAAFIGVLESNNIPVTLQTLTVKVKFTWSFRQQTTISESASIDIWLFNFHETASMTDTTKQALSTEAEVVMVPAPRQATAPAA
ncbi:MAG: hypothetical protein M1396_02490 [Chloroflexi bacterium]|nr:hypothetical protein [Chloroflexota bacterium]